MSGLDILDEFIAAARTCNNHICRVAPSMRRTQFTSRREVVSQPVLSTDEKAFYEKMLRGKT